MSGKAKNGKAAIGSSQANFEEPGNAFVYSPKKLVAFIGIKDVSVVETKDALLLCKKGRSQDVKKIVDALEAGHLNHLL
jgi:mannose-1-phosphate guanylyltransferase